MTLYEINEQIIEAWKDAVDPETGEIINDINLELIESLELEKDEKIENCALYIKNLLADAKAISEEEDKLEARRKKLENKAERIKNYVSQFLEGEQFTTPRVDITFKTSQSVEILDIKKLDDKFLRYKSPEPNKVEIKKILKQGGKVDGATLVTKSNMTIK